MPRLSDYDFSVFINCPFDSAYKPIFDAIVFTVYDCGFIPRSAREAEDVPHRLERIIEIVGQSRLAIHDLSRAGLDKNSRLARFNMPFELGLFLGAERFGSRKQSAKSFTLFDKERYRYQKFISDLNGIDPRAHGLRVESAVKNARDFMRQQSFVDFDIPGAAIILRRYRRFKRQLKKIAVDNGHDPKNLQYIDYCLFIEDWCSTHEWT